MFIENSSSIMYLILPVISFTFITMSNVIPDTYIAYFIRQKFEVFSDLKYDNKHFRLKLKQEILLLHHPSDFFINPFHFHMVRQACVSVDVNPFMECKIFFMNVWTMTFSFDSFPFPFSFYCSLFLYFH